MTYGRYNPATRRAYGQPTIPAGYRPVFGNTFPVKDQLKALGAKWDGDRKLWHVPAAVYDAAVALVPQPAAKAPAARQTVDLSPVVAFLTKAKDAGLKFPKVRFTGGLELSLASERAAVPGSVTVVIDGEWKGRVTQSGEAQGYRLTGDAALLQRLLDIAADPAKAAKLYAQQTGSCTFCQRELTDAGSIEVGYGPICADRYGLPHTAKGHGVKVEVALDPATPIRFDEDPQLASDQFAAHVDQQADAPRTSFFDEAFEMPAHDLREELGF